ncbi:hypothetical protein B0H10DRAFT_1728911, partial [Mycena sp. CBHHK59/15]
NAIMFSNPTLRDYNVLPPSQEELSEVLAFVFLRTMKPTEEEYERTPMHLCHQHVQDALDWLKLSHCDYADLEISQDNLDALPEKGIPFGVDWKETKKTDSNRSPE